MAPQTSELPVHGCSVTEFDRYGDSRGYFNELYNDTKYEDLDASRPRGESTETSLPKRWRQVSFSSSQKHALRGLHCSQYGKFITCVRGAFYDVIADCREDSPTFGRWCGVLLTEHNKKQVYVPAGCGHGFFTFEDDTCALYLQEGTFNPPAEADMHPFDPLFNVKWPVPEGVEPIMSAKDIAAPTLATRRPHLVGLEPRRRVLVVGASGQVGGAIIEAFGARDCIGTYCGNKQPSMVRFDLGAAAAEPKLAEALLQSVYPETVIICAGFTWVDGCENDVERAKAMNCDGQAAVAAAAKAIGAKVVWYSTDYVFCGGVQQKPGPYAEDDPVNPLNVYGKSKLDGEAAVLAADPTAIVIRTNVVFGPESAGKNFVYQVARKLRPGSTEEMRVPEDQVNTPTYNRDLASATKMLIEAGASGVYNVGGAEVLGRVAFTKAIVENLNELVGPQTLSTEMLTPVVTSNAGQAALRPLASGLKLEKAYKEIPQWRPRPVAEALRHWMDNPVLEGSADTKRLECVP